MAGSRAALPFDVLFYITSHLGFDDIVSLAHSCRQLRSLLQENGICRKAIEAEFKYTKEARLAQEQRISYCDAFSHIQDRRHAFSKAHPFSARVIGRANDFCYRKGILCILEGNTIRVSDAHAHGPATTIDLSLIIVEYSESSSSSSDVKLSLLYYNDDIVTIYVEGRGRHNNGRLYAITTKPGVSDQARLIKRIRLEASDRVFARHTSRFLYYGTYTSVGSQGHYEWEVQGVSLNDENSLPCTPIQLHGFFGTDLGPTIAFEIHEGYFYAVSNQSTFEAEEIDWTSFYHCMRLPVDNPKAEFLESNKKLWRRQHDEGVIHDSWTDLSLQIDESTNDLMIVEARREYQKNLSRQVRTYYISEFVSGFDSPSSSTGGSPLLEASTGPELPWGDAYIQTLDSTNNPNYAPPESRFNWNFHPEVLHGSNAGRPFILARTKLRAYNYSCASFMDMVEDDRCCTDLSTSCLRLRIGSRRVAPLDWADLSTTTPQLLTLPALLNDVAYRHSPTRMWPPSASRCPCSKRLHHILNPPLPGGPAYNRSITGTLDERSLVYMIRPGRSYSPSDDNALGIVVMISFNRGPLPPKHGAEDRSREHGGDAQYESEWRWVPGASGRCRERSCQ
ncbi:uncharacterized protein CC84DRAFT_1193214 [Paraphaeosphaeria sporulosa]|uniref:F-box domain-containing protein n=1 Tax=Paraphaeosphaeria sporulosa TaxID=1460663 RepID=A0A177CQW6_9PLEO|nr:uncharacterized protein CC84DRAFT_1193214 [Paraphaeosphaeria sporulosa]OAG09348.1 hypothetical protein CC84DRAFT_1193214 [Paraphaeosphaeria sporulosa]